MNGRLSSRRIVLMSLVLLACAAGCVHERDTEETYWSRWRHYETHDHTPWYSDEFPKNAVPRK